MVSKHMVAEDDKAALIAAAPELLEACQRMIALYTSPSGSCYHCGQGMHDLPVCLKECALHPARAAVAKALGR